MPADKKAEFSRRKQEAGHQIYLKNLEDATNKLMEAEAERYSAKIAQLVESGLEHSEAEKVLEKSIATEEARKEKLAERRERQAAAYAEKLATTKK
jgi:hypothetical protein